MGAEENYLDHMKFRGDPHDQKVCEIMNRELQPPHVKAPVPRPTRAILLTSIWHTRVLACWMESSKEHKQSMKIAL